MARGDDLDALIAQAQEGDVRAFESLLASHLPQIRRFARAYATDPADADDLAQEALIKVYKSLRSFRYQSAFATWLYAIVRNVFLDALKSRAGKERAAEEQLAPQHMQGASEDTPDVELQREQERNRIWAALRQVPPEFRSALVLFDIEGCSYDEVAAIEGVAVGTVKSRLSRGRAHLRRLLGEPEEPASDQEPGTSSVSPSSNSSEWGHEGAAAPRPSCPPKRGHEGAAAPRPAYPPKRSS